MPSNAPQTPSKASTVAGEVSAPDGLDARGAALWGRVTAEWALRHDEAELLLEACRTLDALERLQAVFDREGPMSRDGSRVHPAAPELRQTRTVLGRLLGQLGLEDEDGTKLPTPTSARARKAAETRWAMHRARGA